MGDIIHHIGALDRALFLFLNSLHHPGLDGIMVAISDRWIWIPFYGFLLYHIIRKFEKKTIYVVLAVGLLIVLSDQISVLLFKNIVQRFRPCHDPRLAGLVHIVNEHCGGSFGFISSHAANVFALAVFVARIFANDSRAWIYGMLFWATLVSYSRIYLGVHYPLDLIGGAIIGAGLAFLIFRILNLVFLLLEQKKSNT